MKICFIGEHREDAVSAYTNNKNRIYLNSGTNVNIENLQEVKNKIRDVCIDDNTVVTSAKNIRAIQHLKDIGFYIIEIIDDGKQGKYSETNICVTMNTDSIQLCNEIEIAIEKLLIPIHFCFISAEQAKVALEQIERKKSENITTLSFLHNHGINEIYIIGEGEKEKYQQLNELYHDITFHTDMNVFDNTINSKRIFLDADFRTYYDINLQHEMKFLSYFMVKPDGMIRNKLSKIIDMIVQDNFTIVGFIPFRNFSENAMKLYYLKPEEYRPFIENHLKMTASIFENIGMIILLQKDCEYIQQLVETEKLKMEIRQLSFSYGNKFGIGFWGENATYQLNMLHCPSPEIEYYRKDFNIMESFGNIIPYNNESIIKVLNLL